MIDWVSNSCWLHKNLVLNISLKIVNNIAEFVKYFNSTKASYSLNYLGETEVVIKYKRKDQKQWQDYRLPIHNIKLN